MVRIGDKVLFEGKEVKVLDIGYLDVLTLDGSLDVKFVSAAIGELCYKIMSEDYYRWVPAAECEPVENDDPFFGQDARSPHLEDLGYKMVGWLDGLPELPDNSKLPEIVTLLMAIQYDKEKHYGSSWKRKGEYRGIMANIDRKYDRLDKMTEDEINGKAKTLAEWEELLKNGVNTPDDVGESKIDAIADLTNYGLLYMTYVKEHYPHVFKVWVERNVPQYLRDKIPFV
jgi:hypothetical protein